MNSLIILVLSAVGILALFALLSMKDALMISPNRIEDPLYEVNNKDLLEIKKLQNLGKPQEALECAKLLAKKHPNNLYNRYVLGMSFMHNYQYREATLQFEALLAHQPNHLDTRELLAECYSNMRFHNRASIEYEYILRFNPDDVSIQKKAADAYMKIKENKKAISLLSKITIHDPDDVTSLEKLAELYNREEEYILAIETLNYALEKKPDSVKFIVKLADLYSKIGKTEDAIEKNLELLDLIPEYDNENQEIVYNAKKNLANMYADQGMYEEALFYYDEIITSNPQEWETYGCKIAYIHLKEGRSEESIEILSNMIKANQKPKEALTLLMKNYVDNGEYAKAISSCIEVLETTSNTSLVHFCNVTIASLYCEWGKVYLNDGKNDIALSKFAEALKYHTHNSEVYYNIAVIHHKGKDYSNSLSYLKKAVAINSSEAKYYIAMAYVYDDLNNFESAIESFNSAIKLDHLNIDISISKGVLLAKNSRFNDAIELFSKISKIKDDNPDVYYNLALAYENTQEIKKACANYEKALSIFPDHIEAKNNLELLKKTYGF